MKYYLSQSSRFFTKTIQITLSILFITVPAFAKTKSIHQEKFVRIGGIEQWITIHGADSTKPVILFLHGGPGSVMSAYDNTIYGAWEKDFVLVSWDQRGAGRTFGKNAPKQHDEEYWINNPLTVDQMAADGIELSEYLIKHLQQPKIILIGTSWGSVLGATMALKKPELYYAYIGHSQVVNGTETLVHAYHTVYKLAQKANDNESINKLTILGVPPYDDAKNTGQLFRIIKKYERENSVPAPNTWWRLAPAYDNETDARNREDGDDYSFINYVGHKKLGIKAMSATVDFMKNGLTFQLPVYIIQGEADILTPQELTKPYFDKLKAPHKEYFLVPGAAHGHNQSVIDTQYKVAKACIASLQKKK
ncbi:alpha/beta hydrolase [Xanthocytophaga agilis]|uniref:Proline iminopeptidase n=1 Tax=Xanthocytophaga agilis TaxID=3048010 RepID=A0AAE3QX06_9BACT|nr:alpha/beta hydrolase [Xanthocytophaga agilis]MDJ1499601.1 alpha/beta hydrolase [Xanthocytophaga agilis]